MARNQDTQRFTISARLTEVVGPGTRERREQRRLPERSARQSEGPARYRGVQGAQSSRQTCVQRAQLRTARGIRRGSACGGAMSPDPGSRHSRKGPACGGARAAQLGRVKGAARSVGCVSPRSQRAVLGAVGAGLGFANGRQRSAFRRDGSASNALSILVRDSSVGCLLSHRDRYRCAAWSRWKVYCLSPDLAGSGSAWSVHARVVRAPEAGRRARRALRSGANVTVSPSTGDARDGGSARPHGVGREETARTASARRMRRRRLLALSGSRPAAGFEPPREICPHCPRAVACPLRARLAGFRREVCNILPRKLASPPAEPHRLMRAPCRHTAMPGRATRRVFILKSRAPLAPLSPLAPRPPPRHYLRRPPPPSFVLIGHAASFTPY